MTNNITMNTIIYINLSQSAESTKPTVKLSDVAIIKCKDKSVESKLNSQIVAKKKDTKKHVVSIMEIIDLVNSNYSNADIQSLGETECVVEFSEEKQMNKALENLKVVLICFVLFFGAAFSIMSFNNDITVHRMFGRMSELILGQKMLGMKILSTCYSLGIGIGIIVFYNHFGHQSATSEPTPIQVEMDKYEKDVNQTIVQKSSRVKGQTK